MANEIISNLTKGSDAGGALKYDFEKDGATMLDTNCASTDRHGIAAEFEAVSASNTRCKANVIHVSLSSGDQRLTDDQWREAGQVYMKEMGLDQDRHQYTLTRHSDTEHDHVHLTINRIDSKTGKAWSDSNDRKRSHEACRRVEKRLGLESTREATKGGRFEQTKADLNDSVKAARGKGLEGLKAEMKVKGYTITVNESKTTGRISGISIKSNSDGKVWKASELRKGGYKGMENQLNNQPQIDKKQSINVSKSNTGAAGKAVAASLKDVGRMPNILPKAPSITAVAVMKAVIKSTNQAIKRARENER